MRIWNVLKLSLGGVLIIGMVLATSQTVNCTNYTSLEEYIEESNKQREAAGYTTYNTSEGITLGTPGNNSAETIENAGKNSQSSEPVKTCEHSYSSKVTKNATCVDLGEVTYTCSKCGTSYTGPIPASGKHDYIAEVTKEATCTEKGETTYTCSVCGDSYTEEIPETEHKYGRVVAEDATCTTDGTFAYICEVCDDSYTEVIPASGHKEGAQVVVKEAGLFSQGETQVACEYCSEVLSSEVIPSILPIWSLIIPIVLIAVICIVIFMLKKQHRNGK